MTDATKRKRPAANPFYVLLLAASTLFVLTTFGYLIGPTVQEQAGPNADPNRGTLALAGWLDRRGPLALGVEITAMIAFGLLAMATDGWFAGKDALRKHDS